MYNTTDAVFETKNVFIILSVEAVSQQTQLPTYILLVKKPKYKQTSLSHSPNNNVVLSVARRT